MNESNFQKNTNKPDDEIDIFEFCSRLWGAFKNFLISIKELIVSIIVFLIRKSLWIAGFLLFGIIVGYVFYRSLDPYYITSIEGDTGGIDNSVVIDHINKLNQVIKKPLLLSKHLGMNVDQVKKIHYIKACYGIDINRDGRPDYVDFKATYNPKDTMKRRVQSFVHIRISVYDESILLNLREKLFEYINNNAYIQNLHKIDRDQKKALIVELDKEIAKIEKLQEARIKKEANTVELGQLVVLGNEPETRLFYTDILSLHNQKQSIQKSLDLSDEIIIVIQDLTPLGQEEITVLKCFIFFGGVMAILGLICSLCWQYRKKIWNLIKGNSTK